MNETKRWPMLILIMMEFDRLETKEKFLQYATTFYPDRPADELLEKALKYIDQI